MILVTGANGFLGSYICKKLLSEKEPFIALVRPSSDISMLQDIQDDIRIHHGDVLDPDSIVGIIEEIDTIIHCAAVVSYHRGDRKQMNEVNVTGTKYMVDLALAHNIKYFVHISSVAALGRNQPSGTISENNKWQHSKWNTSYGESKYLAELEVWRGIMEGLNAVILNPSVILGPGDWSRSSARLFKYVWDEKKFYTEGLLNYVDVRDVADIVFTFLKKRTTGQRYIINADGVTYKNFFDEVANKSGKKAPGTRATPSLVRLAMVLEGIKSIFTGQKPLITRETTKIGDNKIYFDNSKIRKELNYNFVPLSQTIDWTCEVYKKDPD
ncbi:Dihydroflavonol-4-reductase [Fulvivirga imtechensis AK7]|uniref:Dihydroflavonol-4-reductase n=1 Tax=Fulvivirga imtechensis AK7 TaxID=1237149 RepID=L8JS63_9BACT|nr:NAD-dependent epimerase/dehydratase family protein [Fulvivirga imtechensis]ELR71786.1 Dihydroflavonol-4-reductase [Fulvivirga imtechensis AK7]